MRVASLREARGIEAAGHRHAAPPRDRRDSDRDPRTRASSASTIRWSAPASSSARRRSRRACASMASAAKPCVGGGKLVASPAAIGHAQRLDPVGAMRGEVGSASGLPSALRGGGDAAARARRGRTSSAPPSAIRVSVVARSRSARSARAPSAIGVVDRPQRVPDLRRRMSGRRDRGACAVTRCWPRRRGNPVARVSDRVLEQRRATRPASACVSRL